MTELRRTAVVIPNLNGQALLDRCLTALQGQVDRDFRVIVVDNASSDGSAEFVEDRFPAVEVVRLDRNRGFAGATNTGISGSDTRYVALLNNDCEPDRGWLEELVACAGRHPRAAAVSSKLLRFDDPTVIDGAGDTLSSYFRAYARGRGEHDHGQYDREVQVFGASGAASLWRRDVLDRIGSFDEDFFAYYEDVDLSFRARLAGYELWYAPGAIARHHGGGTSAARAAEFAFYYSVRNRWAMIVKNVPGRLLAVRLPLLVLAEGLTVVRAGREGQLRHLLRAYAEIARSLPTWLRRRRVVQSQGVISATELTEALTRGYPQFRARVAEVLRPRGHDHRGT